MMAGVGQFTHFSCGRGEERYEEEYDVDCGCCCCNDRYVYGTDFDEEVELVCGCRVWVWDWGGVFWVFSREFAGRYYEGN
jgi:hypothetical protein